MTFDSEIISKFIDVKQKISELEKKHEKYKSSIDKYMTENSISKIEHNIGDNSYTINKKSSSRETIAKKDLPADIWTKYCSLTRFNVITVAKK
jgi:SMC interacting uncharacterized protein involved in chromosome segregation